jgi:hypothetical protein
MVKSGVQKHESGGGLVDSCYLDSIFEFDAYHQLRKVIETPVCQLLRPDPPALREKNPAAR